MQLTICDEDNFESAEFQNRIRSLQRIQQRGQPESKSKNKS
jgi:hypothetical protein